MRKISDSAFIAEGAILAGNDITIGDNVIIGAGSLVNKDIPSGTVAAGVPCRVIGKFEDYQQKMKKEESE